jgi:hypothetical protein
MAEFCVAVKITPGEFRQLTLLEYTAFIEAFAASKGSDLEGLI